MHHSTEGTAQNKSWIWVLLVVGILITVFFGIRTFRSFAQMQLTGLTPGTTDVNGIRGWMTIPYLAKIYAVPEEYLFQQLAITAFGNSEKSLADLNKEYFPSQAGVALQKVKDAIQAYQRSTPPSDPTQ